MGHLTQNKQQRLQTYIDLYQLRPIRPIYTHTTVHLQIKRFETDCFSVIYAYSRFQN